MIAAGAAPSRAAGAGAMHAYDVILMLFSFVHAAAVNGRRGTP